MIKSMTGYGRAEVTAPTGRFTVEIKSVNKKSLDIHVSIPREIMALERPMVKLISGKIERGRVSVSIARNGMEKLSDYLVIDEELAEEYYDLLKNLKSKLDLAGDIDLSMILSAREVIKFRKPDLDVDESWKAVKRALQEALKKLIQMRETEGAAIYTDIDTRRKKLGHVLTKISRSAPGVVKRHKATLFKKARSLGRGVPLDEGRLMAEVALFADRADITEEITRLRSHFSQFKKLLTSNKPVGRTLDFLIQEMYREVNTLGSKANSAEISRNVVYFKSELEKIREQVQNIE